MAPMIDMVFLLLVFFMTVSTLAKEARPEIGLPSSMTATVPAEAPPREIITLMKGKGMYRIFWYNNPVEKTELEQLLSDAGSRGRNPEILLRGSPEVPWSEWEPILGILRKAGVNKVIFATFEA